MAIYAAMIDSVDQNIGKLLAKVEELNQLNNTLIMFASDSGASGENAEKNLSRKFKGEMGTIGYWASQGKEWVNVSNAPFRKAKRRGHLYTLHCSLAGRIRPRWRYHAVPLPLY